MGSSLYAGTWISMVDGHPNGELKITFKGQVCETKMTDFVRDQSYIGIGLLYDGHLFISEVNQMKTSKEVGGVCIYTPIPMTNTFYAYWTSFGIFPSLGSGFAIKKSLTPDFFQGAFSINYYDDLQKKLTPFDLKIETVAGESDLKILSWNGVHQLSGIGLRNNDFLSLAWGAKNKNWQIKRCSNPGPGGMEITTTSLTNPVKTTEIFERKSKGTIKTGQTL